MVVYDNPPYPVNPQEPEQAQGGESAQSPEVVHDCSDGNPLAEK